MGNILQDFGPLGTPAHYNGLIFGNHVAEQADCEGALAVGGTITLGTPGYGYDVGAGSVSAWSSVLIGQYDNPNGYPSLLLGGKVDQNSTTARIYGGTAMLKQGYRQEYEQGAFGFQDPVVYAIDADVDDFFTQMNQQSVGVSQVLLNGTEERINLNQLSQIAAMDKDKYLSKTIKTDKRILIYTVNCGPEDDVTLGNVVLDDFILDYDMLVINIPAGRVRFAGGATFYNGDVVNTSVPRIYPENELIGHIGSKLVYNLPNAVRVDLTNHGLLGSVLAPGAVFAGQGGSINGMLVAQNLEQSAGMELHAFGIAMGDQLWTLETKKTHTDVTVQKQDADTLQPLPGAGFRLFIYNADYSMYVPVANETTNQQGQITFTDLGPGDYRLFEETAPPGYELPPLRTWDFSLELDDEGEIENMETIIITNAMARYAAEFVNLDYDDRDITLEGTEFDLYKKDADTQEYELHSQGHTTDEDGCLRIENLLPGDYKLVETQACPGYKVPEECETLFAIEDKDLEPIEIYNKKAGGVQIFKVDSENPQIFLEGAEFELSMKILGEYQVIRTGLITDENGSLVIDELEEGDYKLTETVCPTAYVLPEHPNTLFTIEL